MFQNTQQGLPHGRIILMPLTFSITVGIGAAFLTHVIVKVVRGSWVWRDGKLIPKSAQVIPFRGLQVIKDIEPFRNVAVDRNEIIGGRRQKRDMMRARNLIEAGDIRQDRPVPKPYDPKAHQRSVVNSLKQALHQHGLGD